MVALKGNCNQNLHLVFIDLIQSTTSITIDTQVLLRYFNSITRYKALLASAILFPICCVTSPEAEVNSSKWLNRDGTKN